MPIHTLGIVKNGDKHEIPVISALPREMTMAEFALLSDEEKLGDIIVTDYPVNEESDYVEVVADGSKTYTNTLNDFYEVVDTSRLCDNSKIVFTKPNGTEYIVALTCVYTNALLFTGTQEYAAYTLYYRVIKLASSGSFMDERSNNSDTVYESQTVPSGTKIRLYYNDAHTFDFNTKAENCIYDNTSSGLSASDVQGAIDEVVKVVVTGHTPSVKGDYATWNTTGIDLSNRKLAQIYIIDNGVAYMISQGVAGIAVGYNVNANTPMMYLASDADNLWVNKDCVAIYV